MTEASVASIVERAKRHEKHAVATLVSLFEDRRESAAPKRAEALALLESSKDTRSAAIVGLTGTPGAGKSSLVARLAPALLERRPALTLAVLAVDPSSPISGGALLGDRTRLNLPHEEPRLYFRSQASANDLGGLGPMSFQVCGLLARLFDCVIVETVGIGQSEADIRHLADRTYLVFQPLGGDQVQFLKAGIMEIPDAFVLNKCDEPSAEKSYHQLRASLWLARPDDAKEPPVFRTSARTGEGIDQVVTSMLEVVDSGARRPLATREAYAFERWVKAEWGRVGSAVLRSTSGGAEAWLRTSGGFDGAQRALNDAVVASLK